MEKINDAQYLELLVRYPASESMITSNNEKYGLFVEPFERGILQGYAVRFIDAKGTKWSLVESPIEGTLATSFNVKIDKLLLMGNDK